MRVFIKDSVCAFFSSRVKALVPVSVPEIGVVLWPELGVV